MKVEDYKDKEDGEYDSSFGGKPTVEKLETKISKEDGVEETHITHTIKQANRWTFSNAGGTKFAAGIDKIDWSK